jgi:hypothetical protein
MSYFQRIKLEDARAMEAAGKAYRPSAHQPSVFYGKAPEPEPESTLAPESEPEPVKEQVYETRTLEAKPRARRKA